MSNSKRELAKFFSGAEAFHAFTHAVLWSSGVNLTIFGIMQTPTLNFLGITVNAVVAILLGFYGWRAEGKRSGYATR